MSILNSVRTSSQGKASPGAEYVKGDGKTEELDGMQHPKSLLSCVPLSCAEWLFPVFLLVQKLLFSVLEYAVLPGGNGTTNAKQLT